MQELLTLEDIERVGGDTSRLEVEVEDVLAAAEAMDPDQLEGVLTWHAMKVLRGGGPAALIFIVVEFESSADARDRLEQIESGLGFEPMEEPVGEGSAKIESSGGAGLAVVKGYRGILVQTTAGEGTDPIINAAALERLARIIAERL